MRVLSRNQRDSPPAAVLRHYPADCLPTACTRSKAGFSGAEVFRLESPRGPLALRRWPAEHPSADRLAWIHSVVTHAARRGFGRVPVPIAADTGNSYIDVEGRLWELAPWLPGRADYRVHPDPARLKAALQTLAELHLALADFRPNPRPVGPSPGLNARLTQLRGLLSGESAAIAGAVAGRCASFSRSIVEAAREILDHFERRAAAIERLLAGTVEQTFPLQPAIRDIHHEHVLFVDDAVTGIIDFGAMRFESIAGDVARLLGSLVGGDRRGWQAGLAAYDAARPLTDVERELVHVFDASGVLLGGMNWLNWLFVERRQFADRRNVQTHLAELAVRLRTSA